MSLSAVVLAACVPPSGGGSGPRPPVVLASVAGSAGPVPFDPSFSSAGSVDPDGTIVSYDWDFGDGTASTEAIPSKAFSSPGTYTVTLTVTDDDGLSTTGSPLTVTAYTPGDPSALVLVNWSSRAVGLGEDLIAVWVCDVEDGGGPLHDPVEVAAWAQDEVEDYFEVVSRDRYRPVFVGAGTFEAESDDDCLDGARDRAEAPYTNVMVVDTTTNGGGFGGPGYVYATGPAGAPGEPPALSRRGFHLRGDSYSGFPNPKVVIHEIGHTLHWPHSFITPTNQYDNYVDVMSAWAPLGVCTIPGWTYTCRSQHTIALNRWASGWVDPGEVVVHTGGTRQVDLARPAAAGTQLVVAPSATSSQALVTIEARPKVGYDEILDQGGVAVHVVDQRPAMCDVADYFGGCPSLWRRQGQATGGPLSYTHVLAPGQTRTLHGLTISVVSTVGSGYRVDISGTPKVATNALAPYPSSQLSHLRTKRGGGLMTVLESEDAAPR